MPAYQRDPQGGTPVLRYVGGPRAAVTGSEARSYG